MDFGYDSGADCGMDRLALAAYSELADGAGAACRCWSELLRHGLGRSEGISVRSGTGTGAFAALRPDQKPGRWRLEAGRRAGRIFGAVAADYRVTGDDPDGGFDGGNPDHLEETGRPDPAQSCTSGGCVI